MIDDVMAQQAFRGEDPIGRHIWIGIGPDVSATLDHGQNGSQDCTHGAISGRKSTSRG
jgi:hypothetical protein